MARQAGAAGERVQQPGAAAGLPVSERTRLRRGAHKEVGDRSVLHAILDAGLVAHVAVVEDGQPFVLPVAYARDGERLLVHGSTGSRLFRRLAAGEPTCLTVTLLDGYVLARSAFETSMHYRSAMVFGRCEPLTGEQEKLAALELFTEHVLPGRWQQVRAPSRKELAATLVLALPLTEASAKVSASPPTDPDGDLDLPVWAGVVPVHTVTGTPVPAPDLRFDLPPPELGTRGRPATGS